MSLRNYCYNDPYFKYSADPVAAELQHNSRRLHFQRQLTTFSGKLRWLFGIPQPAFGFRCWPPQPHLQCPNCKADIVGNPDFLDDFTAHCSACSHDFALDTDAADQIISYCNPVWPQPPKCWLQRLLAALGFGSKLDEPWGLPPVREAERPRTTPRVAAPFSTYVPEIGETVDDWGEYIMLQGILNLDPLGVRHYAQKIKMELGLNPGVRPSRSQKLGLKALLARRQQLERDGVWDATFAMHSGQPNALDIAEGVWLGNKGPSGWWLLHRLFGL